METLPNSTDLFRPSKRRKFYRKRAENDDDPVDALTPPIGPLSPSPDPDETNQTTQDPESEQNISIADLLRQRKSIQRRKAGVEFTSSSYSTSTPPPSHALELVQKDEDTTPAAIKEMENRFAPQTGRVTEETDQHMYNFPSSISLCYLPRNRI